MLTLGWVTAECTTRVSDDFVAHASRPKPLLTLLHWVAQPVSGLLSQENKEKTIPLCLYLKLVTC